jgi:hypothetical protein
MAFWADVSRAALVGGPMLMYWSVSTPIAH